MIRPARISPTTCGALHLRATSPKNFRAQDYDCQITKTEYTDILLYYYSQTINHSSEMITEQRDAVRCPAVLQGKRLYYIPLYKKMQNIFYRSFCQKA